MAYKKQKMSVLDMVKYLRSQGTRVTYKKRSDGGYLIKSINGVKFQGAKGNVKARELLGQSLGVSQAKQLKKITTTRIDFQSLPKEIQKLFNRTKASWEKNIKNGKYERTTAIKIAKKEGAKKLKEKTVSNLRYAEGYANIPSIDKLIWTIRDLAYKISYGYPNASGMLYDLAQRIEQKKTIIREKDLEIAIEVLYNMQNDPSIINEDSIVSLIRILGV